MVFMLGNGMESNNEKGSAWDANCTKSESSNSFSWKIWGKPKGPKNINSYQAKLLLSAMFILVYMSIGFGH